VFFSCNYGRSNTATLPKSQCDSLYYLAVLSLNKFSISVGIESVVLRWLCTRCIYSAKVKRNYSVPQYAKAGSE
jgi:hypothetical protein